MTLPSPISPLFPTRGRPARWGRHIARHFVLIRRFATLVAFQQKNSRCEPNLKIAQLYDPTGMQHKSTGKSGYEVSQADRATFPTLGRPARWGGLVVLLLAPFRRFATLVAFQQKNSAPEPNLKIAQLYDPTGMQHESTGKSGYEVSQADGMTNGTLRGFAHSRGPSSSSPMPPAPPPLAISRHSSRSRRKIRHANPIWKTRNPMIRKEWCAKAPENPDMRLLNMTAPSSAPPGSALPHARTSPQFRDTRCGQTRKMNKQTQLDNRLI
jgi:hypothetical protein